LSFSISFSSSAFRASRGATLMPLLCHHFMPLNKFSA
jgi:hypothetical protein